jgi:hypothetical protein
MKPAITVMEFTKPAMEMEDEMDAAFAAEAPKGKFSGKVMNQLVEAYRRVQELMGFSGEDLYPEFVEPTVREFPPEFVRGLAMVAKAAEDYGMPGMIDLSSIRADADVAELVVKLNQLADDAEFAKFLESGDEEDTGDMPSATEGGGMEDSMDDLFASRAR